MLNINKENYVYYKRIYEIIWTCQAPLLGIDVNADISPIHVLKEWEQKSMSIARRGLKAGLLDSLQMLSHFPAELKEQIDKKLIDESFPALYKLTSAVKDTPAKVLKRGKVRNLEEYYIIKEVLDDTTSDISLQDRTFLNNAFLQFESTYAKRKNHS
ncbi:MAG: hypothetical protein JWR72_1478 [Flavisolibacter sp.]|jgi:hypothetical protein|nr:hypothetical protein [Flavisolibacter sp.]